MSPKFVASEFSAKVKAYNQIEENILKQRLDGYRRQRKNNLRMIEKDSKKMQEKILQSSLRISDTLQNADHIDYPYLNHSGGGDCDLSEKHLETLYHNPNQLKTSEKRTATKKRRKKKSQKSSKNNSLSSSMLMTRETFLYKNETEIEPSGKRHRSPVFLPSLHVHANSSEQLTMRPMKMTDNLSLPPINGPSLTSSVSLPSLHKFNKYASK